MEIPKPVKAGYRYGLILLVTGIVLVAINTLMIVFSDRYFPKLLVTGAAITLMAPVFFIFPGGTLDKMPEMRDMGKALFRNAPLFHKIIWIVWGIAAVAGACIALFWLDPGFFRK